MLKRDGRRAGDGHLGWPSPRRDCGRSLQEPTKEALGMAAKKKAAKKPAAKKKSAAKKTAKKGKKK